jgi:hypothetical protein
MSAATEALDNVVDVLNTTDRDWTNQQFVVWYGDGCWKWSFK